jgi:uncharacterized membrane protein HdeD (DUF308 family)
MKTNLQKNWWLLTVNGALAILFGGLALFATETLMISISMYFGLLVLVGGLLLLLGAFDQKRKEKKYSMMLAQALIAIIIGILIMVFPGKTLKLFLIFVGVWAVLLGLLKIYVAVALKKMSEFRYVMIFGGIIIVAIGLLLLLNPAFVAGLVLKIVGGVFVVVGMMLVYFSFVVKNAKTE